jgi:bifunctional DNA primase/polymerase-like protein
MTTRERAGAGSTAGRGRPGMVAAALAAALAAADTGWPVFVLGRSRRPVANCRACRAAGRAHRLDPARHRAHDPEQCACLTCHAHYAATTDPDRIRAMFAAVPRGLLAVRTGAPSGLVVVDIDPRNGGRLDPTLMPPTRAAVTGGDGWHLFYRHPGHHVPSRPLPDRRGVDIKADGGLVVLAPSIHPDTGKPYRWLPDVRPVIEMAPALAGLVTNHPTRPPAVSAAAGHGPPRGTPTTPASGSSSAPGSSSATGTAAGTSVRISSPPALQAAILAAVDRAPEGRRRTTLYGAARGMARLVLAGAITRGAAEAALTDAGRNAHQNDRQIRDAIAGGFHDEGLPE